MTINKDDILALVKMRLQLDPLGATHDQLINMYMDEIEQRILSYINHSSIPDRLRFTWAAMVAGALAAEQSAALFPTIESSGTFEISIGDTSIKPVKAVSAPLTPSIVVVNSVLFDYRAELNAFRKLRW
ncbi:hypothetical protein Back11_11680 [Paenibacillus baekrokdamisoli]|uniref:DNA-packaging protein n=1 Tax=Paenibacillus baekrokdamisoli TaxID=1712516 RepID=A0A3G9J4Y9_9BACL|nr:DNA-packaging protein [Paenibacillus baekrokdamisoli]BBH19823.1 hypothetical protein Back11_11680 [Paenibacillus baekrokdamisoli]